MGVVGRSLSGVARGQRALLEADEAVGSNHVNRRSGLTYWSIGVPDEAITPDRILSFVKCVCVAFVAVAGRRYAYTVCSLDDA